MDMPASKNLIELIKQLIKEEQYEGVALLFTSPSESARNLNSVEGVAMELYHDVCLLHLTEANHNDKLELYICVEELLKVVAMRAPPEEMLLELLEMVEETKSEFVFTSALRAMQIVLLRIGESMPSSLEWSLNSVHCRLQELPLPEYLTDGYDSEQERLLEQSEEVQSLLMHYITVGLFFEPILKEVMEKERKTEQIFRDCGTNRRNVLCCFLVNLLGKPLSLLDLSIDGRNSNSYTTQCARNLTQAITQCIGDPFYFLTTVEQRARWKRKIDPAKGVYERTSQNIFFREQNLPLEAMAMYYYMLLVEKVEVQSVPKVYAPIFVFEAGIYLVYELLSKNEPALQYRGILFAKYLLNNLHQTKVPASSLEMVVHKNFCIVICGIVGYSPHICLRQTGVVVLRKYIEQFEDKGRFLIIKNLLRTLKHSGVLGYLTTIYKDLVSVALYSKSSMPADCCGVDFRCMLLQHICILPEGAETDLMANSDKIIATLNVIFFFTKSDCKNLTGFWDFIDIIEDQYLVPLRKALDLSVAHYKEELKRTENGVDVAEEAYERARLKMLNVSIDNAKAEDTAEDLDWNRKHKLEFINRTLATFDIMRSVAAYATEDAHNWLLACSAYASAVLQNVLPPHQPQQEQLSRPAVQRRHYAKLTVAAPTNSNIIDEFRAREEQREEDFERQQKAKEEQQNKQDSSEDKVAAIRSQILAAAMVHVPTLGWNRNAIIQGAEDAGFPSVVHGMFPEGGYALVSYYYGNCNEQLLKQLQAETQNGKLEITNPAEFLVRAVRTRLEMIAPYKGQWPQALALMALPQNAPTALAQLLTLVDDICYYSGDRSVDLGWYTRRIGVATIMKMTELYLLRDESPNHEATWKFLENRMDDAVQLQMMLSQTDDMTQTVQRSFNSAFITARNMLGLDYTRR